MSFRKHTPLLILAALAGTLVVQAAPPATVSFKALYFDPRETGTPEFFVSLGGSRKALEIEKSRLSDLQSAGIRDGRFVDFHMAEVPHQGEPLPLTLTLPAGSLEDFLFIITPAATGFTASAIPIPPAEFKGGDTLLVNAAQMEIAVRPGTGRSVNVASGASGILALPGDFKEPMMPVRIFERADPSEQWTIAQSTRWAVDHRFRSYLFFYQTPGQQRLRMHGVTERIDSPNE